MSPTARGLPHAPRGSVVMYLCAELQCKTPLRGAAGMRGRRAHRRAARDSRLHLHKLTQAALLRLRRICPRHVRLPSTTLNSNSSAATTRPLPTLNPTIREHSRQCPRTPPRKALHHIPALLSELQHLKVCRFLWHGALDHQPEHMHVLHEAPYLFVGAGLQEVQPGKRVAAI